MVDGRGQARRHLRWSGNWRSLALGAASSLRGDTGGGAPPFFFLNGLAFCSMLFLVRRRWACSCGGGAVRCCGGVLVVLGYVRTTLGLVRFFFSWYDSYWCSRHSIGHGSPKRAVLRSYRGALAERPECLRSRRVDLLFFTSPIHFARVVFVHNPFSAFYNPVDWCSGFIIPFNCTFVLLYFCLILWCRVLTTLFFVLVGFTIWIWPSRLMTASIPSLVLFFTTYVIG